MGACGVRGPQVDGHVRECVCAVVVVDRPRCVLETAVGMAGERKVAGAIGERDRFALALVVVEVLTQRGGVVVESKSMPR